MKNQKPDECPNFAIYWFPVMLTCVAIAAVLLVRLAVIRHSARHAVVGVLLTMLAVWMFRLLAKTKAIGNSMLGKFANGFLVSGGLGFLYGLYSFTFGVSNIYGSVPRSHGVGIMASALVLVAIGLPVKFMAFVVEEARRQEEMRKSNQASQALGASAPQPER